MQSLKEKGLKETEKQRLLDEIHQYPDVRKTFLICEIYFTINWIINTIFLTFLLLGIWFNNLTDVIEFSNVLITLIDAVGGYVSVIAFVILKMILRRIMKNYRTKLQILEDAKLKEIELQKQEGTYVVGKKASLPYRIYRAIRTWSTLILVICLFIVVYDRFL